MPFGILYSTKISVAFPFTIPKFMVDDVSSKVCLVLSNLNASRKSFTFDDKQLIGHYFVAPGVGKLATGVSFCTIGERMSFAVFSDSAYMKNPQEFCDIFQRKNEEILAGIE